MGLLCKLGLLCQFIQYTGLFMKLLIVEDERELSRSIVSYLSSEKYICELANDFNAALDKIWLYEYSCIILDLSLPNGNGLDLLKEIKRNNKSDCVVIISARNSIDDKVCGLNKGADDYLAKPFHLSELGARVASVIRRKSFGGKTTIVVDGLILDIQAKTLGGPSGRIDLTRMEYMLLEYFMANKNQVITKEAIAGHLCGDDIDMADNYDFIYTHLKNLRKKLKGTSCTQHIKTVYGMGYKFSVTG
jgi:DNA-binding response OmpR family regulator